MSNGPLSDLKVIDLTHIMAGPTCTMMLADMGADVIKIEKLPGGDDTRRSVPPTVGDESAAFMIMNRNKRGLALNIKEPAGNQVLNRLLENADVLVSNFRPGTLERLGFGYEVLQQNHPELIYCELSGFGLSGPYQDRRGFDLMAQAMSGIMSVTGEADDKPRVKCGPPLTDIAAGILAAMGILAAYTHRLKTGKGQRVDTSLFEAGIIQTYWQSAMAFATGIAPSPLGSAHPLNAPYQAFDTADGSLVIGGSTQPNWLRLTQALDAPELADDPRFKENRDRMNNIDSLVDELRPLFRRKTTEQWLATFEKEGVPAGPVNDIIAMHHDPQTLAREMVVEIQHPTAGPVKALGAPVKFSLTPSKVERPAPRLGEHSRTILQEIGYTKDEIETLIDSGVVSEPPQKERKK